MQNTDGFPATERNGQGCLGVSCGPERQQPAAWQASEKVGGGKEAPQLVLWWQQSDPALCCLLPVDLRFAESLPHGRSSRTHFSILERKLLEESETLAGTRIIASFNENDAVTEINGSTENSDFQVTWLCLEAD